MRGQGQPAFHPPGRKRPALPSATERFSNIYIAVITSKGRQVPAAPSSGGAPPALPSVVSSAPTSQPKIETVASVKGPVAWRAVLVRHSNGQEVLIAASLALVDATDAQLRLVSCRRRPAP